MWNVCSRKGWKQLAGNNGRITGGGVSLLFRKVIVKKKVWILLLYVGGGRMQSGRIKSCHCLLLGSVGMCHSGFFHLDSIILLFIMCSRKLQNISTFFMLGKRS